VSATTPSRVSRRVPESPARIEHVEHGRRMSISPSGGGPSPENPSPSISNTISSETRLRPFGRSTANQSMRLPRSQEGENGRDRCPTGWRPRLGDRRTRLCAGSRRAGWGSRTGRADQVRGPAQTEARPPLGQHVHTSTSSSMACQSHCDSRAQEWFEGGLDIKAGNHAFVVPACVPAQLDGERARRRARPPSSRQPRPILVFPALDQCLIDRCLPRAG